MRAKKDPSKDTEAYIKLVKKFNKDTLKFADKIERGEIKPSAELAEFITRHSPLFYAILDRLRLVFSSRMPKVHAYDKKYWRERGVYFSEQKKRRS